MPADDAPSGLPPDQKADLPLGVDEAEPDDAGERRHGDDVMPGIPDEEPQSDG